MSSVKQCGAPSDDWVVMVVMLMSCSFVVRVLFVLWGVGPILSNGYGV